MWRWKEFYRMRPVPDFSSFESLVWGIDPAPKKMGIGVVGKLNGQIMFLYLGQLGLVSTEKATLNDVASLGSIVLPFTFDILDKRNCYVHIERQDRTRDQMTNQMNTLIAGAMAAAAAQNGFSNIAMVSGSSKMTKGMMSLLGAPNVVVPKGAENRIARKKLAVETVSSYATSHFQAVVAHSIELIKPSGDAYDPVDAALIGLTKYVDTHPRKRKTPEPKKTAKRMKSVPEN